jgi:hypothetical protein
MAGGMALLPAALEAVCTAQHVKLRVTRMSDSDEANRAEWMGEQTWHIENATTDLSQFMRPLAEGVLIEDAPLCTPEGESCRLSDLWSSKPALLVTGSLTCPPARMFNSATSSLRDAFGDQLTVSVLYVIDAHPTGDVCPYTGTDWPGKDNRKQGIVVRQPRDQTERNQRAAEYRDRLGIEVPVYVDSMANTAWEALGRSPNMAALVREGRCVLFQDWFKPDEIQTALEQVLAQ